MSEPRRLPIALVGLMGAGKSSVARVLGRRLDATVVDLDQALEAEAGCSVAEIFARFGERAFRDRERALLTREAMRDADVVACGGGVVLDPECRELLRARFRTAWLEVSPAEAARRVGAEAAGRPLLAGADPRARLEALLAERAALYAEVARARIATEGSTPEQVAEAVIEALEGAPR